MKEILIGKDVVYATGSAGVITDVKQIDTLTAGSIAMFDDRNVLITAATTSANLVDSSQFYLAVGQTDSAGNVYTKISRMIDRNAAVRVKTVPVTGVARVDTIGGAGSALNLPSTLVAGTTATVKIRRDFFAEDDEPLGGRAVNILPGTRGINVEVAVTAGDTVDTFTAKIVTAINAHANNDQGDGSVWVTAAATGTGATRAITLTAAIVGQEWTVGLDGIIIDATKTATTATTYAQGLATQIAEMEQLALIEDGNTNRKVYPALHFKKPSEVVAGATYTTYTWKWKVEKQNSGGVDNTSMQEVTYAVPSGATTLIALLDAAFLIIHSSGIDSGSGNTQANIGANP